MPIAHGPLPSNIAGRVLVPGASAAVNIIAGHAVAIVDNGGSPEVVLCGTTPTDHSDLFAGFARRSVSSGFNVQIISGRGSAIEPIVEGGGSLTPDVPVFLSNTPGEVTQTPPSGSGFQVRRVGFAISTTRMIVETDYKPFIG